jgi:hypothetical protein
LESLYFMRFLVLIYIVQPIYDDHWLVSREIMSPSESSSPYASDDIAKGEGVGERSGGELPPSAMLDLANN